MKKILLFLSAVLVFTQMQAQNGWTPKADFGGTGRYAATGFSIGSKGYIGTGVDSFGSDVSSYKKDFWEYDPATNAWTQKADFGGTTRQGATGFSIGSKGYIGTGVGDRGWNLKNDFWEYDPATNQWTQKADFSGTACYLATGFSIGSKGYIGTGIYSDNTYRKDFWEYDPATDAWTRKADFGGTYRFMATGFSIGSKGYIGTGVGDSDSLKDFWEYSPATNLWTQKADFRGTARYKATGFSIGSKGYIGTGQADNGAFTGALLNDFWEYDSATNQWTQKADIGGTGRTAATGFSIGSKGYIGTGYDGIIERDFWEYDPAPRITLLSASSFCAGDSVTVQFSTDGTYNTGNTFTAQLSDASGSFASPAVIGSISSTASGSINADIPAGTQAGTAYRIRVVSSDPVITGTDNGTDLTVNAPATYYVDADNDGFGSTITDMVCSSTPPVGYSSNNTDCNDADAAIHENCGPCKNATNLTTTSTTSNSATVNWVASANPAQWQVQYKSTSPGSKWKDIPVAVTARSVTITGLKPNQSYNWHIRAKCGTKLTSYSGSASFKTSALSAPIVQSKPLEEPCDLAENPTSITLHPNPSNGRFVINLRLSNNNSMKAKIELVNMLGQTVHIENGSIANGKLQQTVSMSSSVAHGMYIVRIIANNKVYQQKLIYMK